MQDTEGKRCISIDRDVNVVGLTNGVQGVVPTQMKVPSDDEVLVESRRCEMPAAANTDAEHV
jgi:hypothetical protein